METMKAGKLVPVSTTIDLIVDRMLKHSGKKFVINGYPKAIDQAKAWKERIPVSAVVHLSCSGETSQVRSASRR
jgi:adenylate kinase family enzyme